MIDDATEVDLIEIEQGGVKQYICLQNIIIIILLLCDPLFRIPRG